MENTIPSQGVLSRIAKVKDPIPGSGYSGFLRYSGRNISSMCGRHLGRYSGGLKHHITSGLLESEADHGVSPGPTTPSHLEYLEGVGVKD